MNEPVWPLVGVCSEWKGRLIESAFRDLLRGIEAEKSRFQGAKYLVMEFRSEFDIDGLTEYLTIHRGFADAKTADDFSYECINLRRNEITAQLGDGVHDWFLDPDICRERRKVGHDNDAVTELQLLSWKAKNRHGFSSTYLQIEVVQIRDEDVIGKELLRYWDAESEWVSYFIDCGRMARPSIDDRRLLGLREVADVEVKK
jgi:hypothetical protein